MVDEADRLSDLAFRSKAHWGYSPEFMEACREELRVAVAAIAAGRVFVLEWSTHAGRLVRSGSPGW